MSVNKLIFRELNEIYKFINNAAPIIQDEKNNLFLHNKQRFNKYGITSQKTFVGESSCGVCSFLLKYYLDNLGIKSKIMKTTFGYGKYLEDHCYLLHNDIIIDPTYRQMILGYNYNDEYSEYIFEKNPFIFVGKYNELESYFENLSFLYKKNYKVDNIKENLIFWQSPKIYNLSIDIDEVKNCKKYAKKKVIII